MMVFKATFNNISVLLWWTIPPIFTVKSYMSITVPCLAFRVKSSIKYCQSISVVEKVK
jgi:hypothetical protein